MNDPAMVALVSAVHETRGGPKVWLNVMRGELCDGDDVMVTHADGTCQRARFTDVGRHPVTAESGTGFGAVDGSGPFKQKHMAAGTYQVGDLLQAPDGPPVELHSDSELARAVRRARAGGARTAGQHLPEEIVALHIQWVLSHAATHAHGTLSASAAYKHVSDVLARYGLRDDADRALLLAAAVLEGWEPSIQLRSLASLGAGVLNTVSFNTPMLVRSIGMALEEGEQFARSYRKSIAVQGAEWRKELMADGRAVSVGWCKKCGEIRSLDERFRCDVCHKESELFRVVIAQDRAEAEHELQAIGPPRHGLFH